MTNLDVAQVRYWTLCALWSIGGYSLLWSLIWLAVARTRRERPYAIFLLGIAILWLWCCLAATPEVQDFLGVHLPR